MSDYSSEYMKPSIVMDSEGEEVRPDVAIPVWVALAVEFIMLQETKML